MPPDDIIGVIAFRVPGLPRAKERPRMSNRHGVGRVYTPQKTQNFEATVRLAAAQAMGGGVGFAGAVEVQMIVRLAPPPSSTPRQRDAMLSGSNLPAKRPDLDNVIKAVLDGCASVAFRNDRDVVKLSAEKRYDVVTGVDISIRALP